MNPIEALLAGPAFTRVYIGALQHQLWEAHHVDGGPEPVTILTYEGTGRGAPQYVANSAHAAPDAGWRAVAQVDEYGHLTPCGEPLRRPARLTEEFGVIADFHA